MEGPSDVVVGAYYAGHAATHGPILELPNGDLLVPLYGRLPEGGTGPATVVRSTDGGRTWPRENESVIGRSATFDFQEPNLSLLKDGSLLSVIRTSINIAYVSRSYDLGRTWTTPVSTDLPASSHHQLVLGNGDVLFTYGDLSGTFGPGRPTVGRLLQHPEREHRREEGHPHLRRGDPRSGHDRPGQPVERGAAPRSLLHHHLRSPPRRYRRRLHRSGATTADAAAKRRGGSRPPPTGPPRHAVRLRRRRRT